MPCFQTHIGFEDSNYDVVKSEVLAGALLCWLSRKRCCIQHMLFQELPNSLYQQLHKWDILLRACCHCRIRPRWQPVLDLCKAFSWFRCGLRHFRKKALLLKKDLKRLDKSQWLSQSLVARSDDGGIVDGLFETSRSVGLRNMDWKDCFILFLSMASRPQLQRSTN